MRSFKHPYPGSRGIGGTLTGQLLEYGGIFLCTCDINRLDIDIAYCIRDVVLIVVGKVCLLLTFGVLLMDLRIWGQHVSEHGVASCGA
jgi:hypothetical protein